MELRIKLGKYFEMSTSHPQRDTWNCSLHYHDFVYSTHMINFKQTEVTDCGLLIFLTLLTQNISQYLTYSEWLIQLYNFYWHNEMAKRRDPKYQHNELLILYLFFCPENFFRNFS